VEVPAHAGGLTLCVGDAEILIPLREIESALTEGERISRNVIGTQDELERARKMGWDGR
jgi:hypothetical protein